MLALPSAHAPVSPHALHIAPNLQRRPASRHGVPDPPLLERRPKNRALATGFGQNGRPARATGKTGSAVAARRMASRRAVRPSRAALATVAASRGTFAVRRFESIGRRPRSATARRARVGARGGIGLRSAPSTNFGWPCARAASRPRPPRSTSRGPRKSDRDAAAALSGPPGAGGPWRASATSARRRPSVDVAERTPIESEVDRAGFVLAQLISDGAIPASEPRRGGATRRPDEGRCRRTPSGSLASLFPRGASPLAPARVGGGPRDVAPNAPRTRSGSHPVARLRGPVGHASDDASQRLFMLNFRVYLAPLVYVMAIQDILLWLCLGTLTTSTVDNDHVISDDDRRLICNPALSFGPRRETRIRWLHIPKTGTSFMNTIWHHGCPDLPLLAEAGMFNESFERKFDKLYGPLNHTCPYLEDHSPATHKPIGPKEWARLPRGTFVSMFRQPAARIISAFYMKEKRGGQCILDCNPESSGCDVVRRRHRTGCDKIHKCQNLGAYSSLPTVRGCQTRMIAGFPCNGGQPVSSTMLKTSLQRLRSFGFVGLIEEWELSVCLFHRRFGGPILPLELHRVRVGVKQDNSTVAVADEADDALYRYVTGRFAHDVKHVADQLRNQSR